MPLNNLKPAWKQVKVLNAMQSIESEDILSIIEGAENNDKTKLQRVLVSLGMFIIITIFCQGG